MIYIGNTKQKNIYIGNTKIKKVFVGSTLVYTTNTPTGQVIFESATPGSYMVTIPTSQNYNILLIGGGAGGFVNTGSAHIGGGSGALIRGTTYINAGTYELIIGAGSNGTQYIESGTMNVADGGYTGFINQIAYGGQGHNKNHSSLDTQAGGSYFVNLSGLTGINGNNSNSWSGGLSLYDNTQTGYGAGGYTYDRGDMYYYTNGINGYAKIIAM